MEKITITEDQARVIVEELGNTIHLLSSYFDAESKKMRSLTELRDYLERALARPAE